jgi:excisionase family DNA binding protein
VDPNTDLITTTEAARLLGYSRQHVVDLCDRGDLPCVRVGSHRRLYRVDVETHRRPPLRREDERSLWLNLALAAKFILNPDAVIEQAKQRLQHLRASHRDGGSDVWFDRWQAVLDSGPDAVLAVMTGRSDEAQAMRSASPMSGLGLLTDDERARVLGAFRAHWRSTHRPAA